MDYFTEQHIGHRDRLRQRIELAGLDGLKPHETMEWLLCHAIPRQDVNELAHALTDHFGGVEEALNAEPSELRKVPGIGKNAIEWLEMLNEMMRLAHEVRREDCLRLGCCMDVFRHACSLRDRAKPPCALQFCVDEDGHLLFRRCITPSLSWGEPAILRDALQDMLDSNAWGAIIVLYTGKRGTDPDEYDIAHAEAYSHALRAARCALLDVVLIDEFRISSMHLLHKLPVLPPDRNFSRLSEDYLRSAPPSGSISLQDFLSTDAMEFPAEYARFDD